MESLVELAAGRTSVFVAHRLSTVQGCDRIYVLKDGQVAEQGTHSELMVKRGGLYRDMWRMQAAQMAFEKQAAEEETGANVVEKGSAGNGNGIISTNAVESDISSSSTVDASSDDDESAAELNTEAAAIERSL